MFRKNGFFLGAMMFNLLVIAFSISGACYAMIVPEVHWLQKCAAVFAIVSMVAAFFYVFRGASKDSAKYFRLFLISFAAYEWMMLVSSAMFGMLPVALTSIAYVFIVILIVTKDLGKLKSLLCCGAVFATKLAVSIATIIKFPGYFRGGDALGTAYIIVTAGEVALSVIMTLCVYAKYVDKTERGRD